MARSRARAHADGWAGFVLGLFVWAWVALPMVRGGPEAVRDMLLSKFINQDADGRWLP